MLQKLIQSLLERSVTKYLKIHQPKLVVVVGSVGKTGTKLAIATVLGEKYRVRLHEGNHNTPLSVPLAMLGVEYPEDVHSIGEWIKTFKAINLRIKGPKEADIIVQELGTDHPGDLAVFKRYLHPDISVVTAVSAEHMEYFKTIDAVAAEELSVASFSELTVINRDDVEEQYAKYAETHIIDTYGLGDKAEYRIELDDAGPLDGKMGRFISPEWEPFSINIQLIGKQNIKSAAAAGLVGAKLGLTAQQIAVGIAKITAVPGRMQLLRGVEGSTLIDDTYNSSPLATVAAIKTLYEVKSPQRIAILGSMNELGDVSEQMHRALGHMCKPELLDWVITIGKDAEMFIAAEAHKNGCQVKSFTSPYDAGGFAHSIIKPGGAVILAKGSQNGVFAEEALKEILHSTEDEDKLVRQSEAWLKRKHSQFSST